jgi:H+-translocating NAD(P) transhydrogenase subunit alpha
MSPLMIGVYVFVLSCFIGYHVIWGVTPALHTPLMAVTNAISAIVVVGAILVAGSGAGSEGVGSIEIIGFFAVFLAAINIFGGFVVTNRMLAMFKKKK